MENTNQLKVRVNVDRLLKKRGLGQRELSRITGVRLNTINKLANGVAHLNIKNVEIIANALQIDDITEFISIEKADVIKEVGNDE